MKNKLIVFEGIDGVGKTTLAQMVQEALVSKKIPTVRYESLEDKNSGFNLIKNFIKNETSIDSSLFFYISSAIHKSNKIREMLKESWVICDRYVYSTLCYHKVRCADLSLVADLGKLPIIKPDFLLLIKVDEGIRLTRTRARKESTAVDLIEKSAGNLIQKTEIALEKFNPIIIDNSDPNIAKCVDTILSLLG